MAKGSELPRVANRRITTRSFSVDVCGVHIGSRDWQTSNAKNDTTHSQRDW